MGLSFVVVDDDEALVAAVGSSSFADAEGLPCRPVAPYEAVQYAGAA